MRILLVEDEPTLAQGLARGLCREGFTVDVASDGAAALVAVGEHDYEVMLLDRDLPMFTGDQVCGILRKQGHPIHILMLTAAGTLADKVAGLDLGADDYLPKPFAFVELLARIRALSRRATARSASPVLEASGVRIDTTRRTVERDGLPIQLTPKEYGVLETLLAARGAWVSVDRLLAEVWDYPDEQQRGVVKVAVHGLRRKLGSSDIVQSSTGFGYRILPDDDAHTTPPSH